MRRVGRRLAFAICLLCAGCAEPPHKEMHQAQGAIDAARAAGADRFAAGEFAAAVDALQRSEAAVTARDYRLALNHALDSRDRAQQAAKMAVEGRADARGEAERAIAEVATLIDRATTQLAASDAARLTPRVLQEPRATVTAADKSLQEARSALKVEDYAAVATHLEGAAAQLQAALAQIDAATTPAPARRKR